MPRPTLKWNLSPEASALSGFHTDPWERDKIAGIAKDADVLIVGTGLTMGDVVVTLREQGHRGRVTAISRHGLLPRTHAEFDASIDFLAGGADASKHAGPASPDETEGPRGRSGGAELAGGARRLAARLADDMADLVDRGAPEGASLSAQLLGCAPLPDGAAGREAAR